MGDIFRSFFGFPNRRIQEPRQPDNNHLKPCTPYSDEDHVDQFGANKFSFSHTNDIFRQFDEMFAIFDRTFESVGDIELPSTEFDPEASSTDTRTLPSPFDSSPRDEMLKHPDSLKPREPIEDRQWSYSGSSWFSRLWSKPAKRPEPQQKVDIDLDETVRRGGLGNIIDDRELAPQTPSSHHSSVFKSVSVRSSRTADGKVEETRKMVDGEGNHKTVESRTMNGQTVRETTKKNRNGEIEVTEDLINMNENDKKNFDERWNARTPDTGRQREVLSPRDELRREFGYDSSNISIFNRLFGDDFSSFSKK